MHQRAVEFYKSMSYWPTIRTCGECQHLVGFRKNRVFYKCELAGVTLGPGSDWRKKWPACGMFTAAADAAGGKHEDR